MTVVYRDKISCSWMRGPLEQKHQRGVPPLKDVILPVLTRLVWKRLQIGTDMVLILTSTGNKFF